MMQIPQSRILGSVTPERKWLLACIDVVVNYVCARHRTALAGWHIEAALVEIPPRFCSREVVALRVTSAAGRNIQDLPPMPIGVLREIGSRVVNSLQGVANVVPDIASPAPDIEGLSVAMDHSYWLDDSATA